MALLLVPSFAAQVRPVYDRGAVGLLQLLQRLNTTSSVLMIGAHPDDEDTALLTYLARGESLRTAYLSLTRGDGGQNIIGPELGEALGVIRTGELLQARRLDGAEQYFTRAYDFGFSKTVEEAKAKWNEKIVICDVVQVIRNFRPAVVVSQFSGTPADGHGQHQYSGYITPLAVAAAADPGSCSAKGPAWTVQKLYIRHGFRATSEPRLRVNTGGYDFSLGRSYFEIAMEARSQHKSQEQGVLELKGPQYSGLNRVGTGVAESSILEGIDNSSERAISTEERRVILQALEEFDVRFPTRILPLLAAAHTLSAPASEADHAKPGERNHRNMIAEAIVLAAGLQIDALAERETVVPGESLSIGVKAYWPEKEVVALESFDLLAPPGWKVEAADLPKTNGAAFVAREAAQASAFYRVTPPASAPSTQPYWLSEPRDGDLFRWNRFPQSHTMPSSQRPLRLQAKFRIANTIVEIERPVEFRFADDVRGEVRREVDVVPPVSLEIDQPLIIFGASARQQMRRVGVTVTNYSSRPVHGSVSLKANGRSDIKIGTASDNGFRLARSSEGYTTIFDLIVPAGTRPGNYPVVASASLPSGFTSETVRTIAYPHIQTQRYYRRATADVKVIDLKTSAVKVGYVAGSGDRVPDAIRQMGFDLEVISDRELAGGNLARFDVVVVGIRAYQVRPDLAANNNRLLDYSRRGGTLIVQYQLPGYAQQGLTPFPTQMGPRVADENAPVRILAPEHQIFNFPNRIVEADFTGWVQERNLYNFSNFSKDYLPLLESHDAGESENSGGLVIAKLGKGNYIYCSYSMFRQLPAGVDGAYRLFANLLSLPKAPKSSASKVKRLRSASQ
ncbi:MAG: PIG-L family deacetylase [Pyrinomonadaceae bacterium]